MRNGTPELPSAIAQTAQQELRAYLAFLASLAVMGVGYAAREYTLALLGHGVLLGALLLSWHRNPRYREPLAVLTLAVFLLTGCVVTHLFTSF